MVPLGAITSAISLLEVVTSSIIDEFGLSRRRAAGTMGGLIAIFGLFSAFSLDVLTLVDQLAGELLLVVGALGMSIFVGWVMKDPLQELARGASPGFQAVIPSALFLVKYFLPVVIGIVLWYQILATVDVVRGVLMGG